MDTNTPQQDIAILLEWEAPALPRVHRTKRWYIVASALVIAASAYGIAVGAWSVVLISILLLGVYILLHGETQPMKHISLTTVGVFYEHAFVRWEDLRGFWIHTTPSSTRLYLYRTQGRHAAISVMLENVNPDEVRWTLAQFLTEESHRRERLLDKITRICQL